MFTLLAATAVMAQHPKIDDRKIQMAVPPEVFSISQTGTEVIKLVIAPDGKIVTCDARVVGHGPIADRQNCKIASKLKASPATDENGQPLYGMAQFWLVWSTYKMRKTPLPAASTVADFNLPISRIPAGFTDNSVTHIDLITAADGKIENCRVTESSGNAALDSAACDTIKANGMSPLTDEAGTPVRSLQSVVVAFAANKP